MACHGASAPTPARTEKAPSLAFTRKALGGETVTVPSPNGPTLLVFWATWSSPDVQLLSKIPALASGRPKLNVVTVSIDDESKDVLATARNYGANFPVVWDEGHAIAEAYRPDTDPFVLVLDEHGDVKASFRGFRHDGELDIDDAIIAALHEDVCQRHVAPASGPPCLRQCARRTAAKCRADGCETSCVRDNARRNASLATCRRSKPKPRAACETECHSEARGSAYDACLSESGDRADLRAECETICGVGPCRDSCH